MQVPTGFREQGWVQETPLWQVFTPFRCLPGGHDVLRCTQGQLCLVWTQFGAVVASSGSLAPTRPRLGLTGQLVYQGHTFIPILLTLSSLSCPSLRDVVSLLIYGPS